jgi:predicted kinase
VTTLLITVGLPGSGKTTYAQCVQEMYPDTVLVSRDDFRQALFGKSGVLTPENENLITKLSHQLVNTALASGRDVVVHDTNLRATYRTAWKKVADGALAKFEMIDLTGVHLDDCIERDRLRERTVGEDVIRSLHKKFIVPLKDRPVEPPQTSSVTPGRVKVGPSRADLLDAYIVDVDGTVALIPPGGRSPFDMTRVSEDLPNPAVVWTINALKQDIAHDPAIIFVSGRDESGRADTETWLKEYFGSYYALYMRPHGDNRPDDVVKYELFDRHIRGSFNVTGVFDDRNRVVKMWREIGLTVFQVAEGDF